MHGLGRNLDRRRADAFSDGSFMLYCDGVPGGKMHGGQKDP